MAIGDINIDIESVGSIATEIQSQYEDISSSLEFVKGISDKLKAGWAAAEATAFYNKLQEVYDKYDNFSTQYSTFLEALTKINGTMAEQQDAMLAAINATVE